MSVLTQIGPVSDNFLPVNQLFGLMKYEVIAPSTLYHGVLPVRDLASGKITFPLGKMVGTWTSVEPYS